MKRFYRNPSKSPIGGVCHGMGYYFGLDPLFFRVGFITAAVLIPKIPLLVYIGLWFLTPKHPSSIKKTATPTKKQA